MESAMSKYWLAVIAPGLKLTWFFPAGKADLTYPATVDMYAWEESE